MKTKKNGQNGQNLETFETVETVEKIETKQEESELLKAFNDLKAENEQLKASKPILMDFEQAAELFRKKAKLLDEISQLENIREQIRGINLETESCNSFDAKFHSLNLTYCSRDPFFKVSNIFVINEFIDFVFSRLSSRIDELKANVQEM